MNATQPKNPQACAVIYCISKTLGIKKGRKSKAMARLSRTSAEQKMTLKIMNTSHYALPDLMK